MYVCMYACMDVCMHVRMHVCVCMYVSMYVCTLICCSSLCFSCSSFSCFTKSSFSFFFLYVNKYLTAQCSLYVHVHMHITISATYCISRNIDSDFNLVIWRSHKDRQINLRHLQSIYTTSMDFSTYSTQNRQFKIPPMAFFE